MRGRSLGDLQEPQDCLQGGRLLSEILQIPTGSHRMIILRMLQYRPQYKPIRSAKVNPLFSLHFYQICFGPLILVGLTLQIKLKNNDMKKGLPPKRDILEYMLTDYEFLSDYQIIQNPKTSKSTLSTFIAQIKNTNQRVRFIKKKFTQESFNRFKTLYKLYKSGIVLADNMFVIEECEELYFYIIEAELESKGGRFCSLMQFLHEKDLSEEERKGFVSKIKILLDCLHQEGEAYAGLDTRSIVVDEENHLYLAPFQLECQFKMDNFSRAYYPPQILGKVNQESGELDQGSMMRWDFWSFGCIITELLFYRSPLFLETSLRKQENKIKDHVFDEQLFGLDEPLKNIITNSLQKDPSQRSLSTSKIELVNQPSVDVTKTIKTKKLTQDQGDVTQLNIYKDLQSGDSQLILNLLSLQGIPFKQELHIIIHLNKKYHFYLEHNKTATNKYKLNKRITIHLDFKDFAKLLEASVLVELKEGSKVTKIGVNLQTLVMMHGGRRLWNKKLIGTYKPNKDSCHPEAKLKVSCTLNSPQIYVQELEEIVAVEPLQIPQKAVIIQPQPDTHPQQKILQEITNHPAAKKNKSHPSSKPQPPQIPSISQISNNLTLLTQAFMQRLSIPQP